MAFYMQQARRFSIELRSPCRWVQMTINRAIRANQLRAHFYLLRGIRKQERDDQCGGRPREMFGGLRLKYHAFRMLLHKKHH